MVQSFLTENYPILAANYILSVGIVAGVFFAWYRRDRIFAEAKGKYWRRRRRVRYLLTFCWNNIMTSLYFIRRDINSAPKIWEVVFLVYLIFVRDIFVIIITFFSLYLFLSEMYTYVKVAVFWLNKNKVLDLLEYLNCPEFKPKENEHKEIIRKSIKTARFVMSYYSTMCVGAVSGTSIKTHRYNRCFLIKTSFYTYFVYSSDSTYREEWVHQHFLFI